MSEERARNMLLGACVADAAALGFHWLYDQDRIASIAGETPEFYPPVEADFDGVKGYFAHGGRSAGALSHYGMQCLVMMRAVAHAGGYDRTAYEAEFAQAFGYGGSFSGYIDRPTRATLDAMGTTPWEGEFYGADDTQMPAVSKLPAVVACHGADAAVVENAVRVTNNNDTAVAYGQFISGVMADVLGGLSPADAVQAAVNEDGGPLGDIMRNALSMQQDTVAVTAAIGMSCELKYGVPSVAHNVTHATGFKQAIRANILAGGDSCGRGIILGALMGAHYGVPEAWVAKLRDLADIEALIDAIV